MALLLLAALATGLCAACLSSPCAGSPTCCGHCGKPGKCATSSPADLSNLPRAHSGVSVSLQAAGAAVDPVVCDQPDRGAHLATGTTYSPPDLYLRNSVLNI